MKGKIREKRIKFLFAQVKCDIYLLFVFRKIDRIQELSELYLKVQRDKNNLKGKFYYNFISCKVVFVIGEKAGKCFGLIMSKDSSVHLVVTCLM